MGVRKVRKRKLLENGNELNEDTETDTEGVEKSKPNVSTTDIRNIVEVDILWKGNTISHMKKFGTNQCGLCMRERLAILSTMRNDELNNKNLLINASSELYGACRHRTRFHRFMKNITPTPSTDEGHSSPKKVM